MLTGKFIAVFKMPDGSELKQKAESYNKRLTEEELRRMLLKPHPTGTEIVSIEVVPLNKKQQDVAASAKGAKDDAVKTLSAPAKTSAPAKKKDDK